MDGRNQPLYGRFGLFERLKQYVVEKGSEAYFVSNISIFYLSNSMFISVAKIGFGLFPSQKLAFQATNSCCKHTQISLLERRDEGGEFKGKSLKVETIFGV